MLSIDGPGLRLQVDESIGPPSGVSDTWPPTKNMPPPRLPCLYGRWIGQSQCPSGHE